MTLVLVPLVSGLVLLGIVLADIVWTTLSVEGGAGPLTSRLTAGVWRGVKRIPGGARILAGPLTLGVGLATWIAGLWVGWTLVFAGAEQPIVDPVSGDPISLWDRAYFAGYSIFTLGNGDFAPKEGPWQIATTLATASGMLVITLTVSYVLSVLSAVTQKRSFASSVSGLGTRAEDILTASWNGQAFRGLEGFLRTFASDLNTLTANHKAYPVLHYFHSGQPQQAPATAIPALDEALTLLMFGVDEDARPPPSLVQAARRAVTNYLGTLEGAFVDPAEKPPPPAALDRLDEAGIPVLPPDTYEDSVETIAKRRRTLLGLARSDVRDWPSTSS